LKWLIKNNQDQAASEKKNTDKAHVQAVRNTYAFQSFDSIESLDKINIGSTRVIREFPDAGSKCHQFFTS